MIRLLPERLYPTSHFTSTLVPWFTGRTVLVLKLGISSGSAVQVSESRINGLMSVEYKLLGIFVDLVSN